MHRFLVLSLLLLPVVSQGAFGAGGPLGIDHNVTLDNDGVTLRRFQLWVEDGVVLGLGMGALWYGGESRIGNTYWRAVDAAVLGGIASTALKYTFTRARPIETHKPNDWFQGKGHYSFPSGEVTLMSAAVTPFILEYKNDHPSVWALELLPAYDAVARLKVGGHWQTDVLAGFALGSATGYLAYQRDSPFILEKLPHGFMVGVKASF
ncbi:MAG: phosphatase PAP2 family protein [Betaproteobacteria bacterium]|nr:MAG: phosphatase PAP2 family protein [Betaproteobacteria bacterium]